VAFFIAGQHLLYSEHKPNALKDTSGAVTLRGSLGRRPSY